MKLDEYLKALRDCPEEFVLIDGPSRKRRIHRLAAELGVDDNWTIFLNADFEKVVKHLQESDYKLHRIIKKSCGLAYILNYNPGTVKLQVLNYVPIGDATGRYTEEERKHYERQERDFNMGIILHPYQSRKIRGVNWVRAIAMVIDDIGQYAQKENIPVCFPNSIGLKRLHDYSQIVYFPE